MSHTTEQHPIWFVSPPLGLFARLLLKWHFAVKVRSLNTDETFVLRTADIRFRPNRWRGPARYVMACWRTNKEGDDCVYVLSLENMQWLVRRLPYTSMEREAIIGHLYLRYNARSA